MYYYLNTFFIFSILGHFLESFFSTNYDSGILAGYWTPIYGIGVIIILILNSFLHKKINVPKLLYPFVLFICCGLCLAITEVIGGYLIQIVFNRVFWNYKNHHFNFGLYTSLEMALVWGFSSLVVVYLLKPIIDFIVRRIPKFITWILCGLFIIDVLYKLSTIF